LNEPKIFGEPIKRLAFYFDRCEKSIEHILFNNYDKKDFGYTEELKSSIPNEI